jgi:magnesium transporter
MRSIFPSLNYRQFVMTEQASNPMSLQANEFELLLTNLLSSDGDTLSAATLSLLDDVQIAKLLESIPKQMRIAVWQLLPQNRYWTLLTCLQSDTAHHLLQSVDTDELITALNDSEFENAIALANILPKTVVNYLLGIDNEQLVDGMQVAMSYQDNQLGRYLNKNIWRVKSSMTAGFLRNKISDADILPSIILVTDAAQLVKGFIEPISLFKLNEKDKISDSVLPIEKFDHLEDTLTVARSIKHNDVSSWVAISRAEKIIGIAPIATLLWYQQDNQIASAVTDEDLFAPIPQITRQRGFWLIINLMTAFLASWVIGWFEYTLQQVVTLAILMPVVASMGGIAGSQTLAVALRGIALGHLTSANIKLLIKQELLVALSNGLILGVLIAVIVSLVFSSWLMGLTIFIAILTNALAASVAGALIPYFFTKWKLDPAISGSVVLTTVTDVVGFFIFLGMGTILLVYI